MSFKQDYRKAERKIRQGRKYAAIRLDVLFWRHRSKKKDYANIYCRITLDGQRSQCSMAIGCEWNAFDQETATIANDPVNTGRLADFKARVFKVFAERELTERKSTAKLLLEIAHGLRQHDNDRLTAIQVANEWVANKEALLGIDIKNSTLKGYRRKRDISIQFLTEIYHKEIMIDDLKKGVGDQLHNYCRTRINLSTNSTVKVVRLFKTFCNYAFENDWADRNPLLTYASRGERKQVVALTSDDLFKIIALPLADSGTARVRDAFVFQCVTGLAYADLASVTRKHIVTHNGVKCIEKPRQKTGELSIIPLLPEAIGLIDKYKNDTECQFKNTLVPILANQKMNAYLKNIGQMAGVNIKLHTHLGRKTFATYLNDRGICHETIANVLGHSKSRVTEMFYIQAKTDTVLKDFKSVFDFQLN
jgi:site-specific recombinase XerD